MSAVFAALCWLPLSAQKPAPDSLIDELVANAELYRATLPSLTADETITSESSYLGLFRQHVEAKGSFRAVRVAPDSPLDESRTITVLNGKPVNPDKKVELPSTLFGGFGRFQEMFFSAQHRQCFAFTLLPEPGPSGSLQIAISVPPEAESRPGCMTPSRGLTGLAIVDAATHQLMHLERTFPDNIVQTTRLAPFASVDSAPTKVGEDTFWLPTVVIGRILTGKVHGQFVAHYSNYHRYTAKVTLLPGASEVDATPAPP